MRVSSGSARVLFFCCSLRRRRIADAAAQLCQVRNRASVRFVRGRLSLLRPGRVFNRGRWLRVCNSCGLRREQLRFTDLPQPLFSQTLRGPETCRGRPSLNQTVTRKLLLYTLRPMLGRRSKQTDRSFRRSIFLFAFNTCRSSRRSYRPVGYQESLVKGY